MFRKAIVIALVLVVVNALLTTGVGSAVLGLAMWALFGYLLWRAWPSVRLDAGRLASRLPRSRRRRRESGVF